MYVRLSATWGVISHGVRGARRAWDMHNVVGRTVDEPALYRVISDA